MNSRTAIIVSAVAAAFCMAGFFPWPYSFYMLLRCVVTASAVYLLARHAKALPDAAKWALVLIALLFNPVVKVHLGRELWQVVDPLAGLFFGWIALRLRSR